MGLPAGHDRNADQIAYWNGPGGQRWADRQAAQDVLLQPVLDLLIDRAAPKSGEANPCTIPSGRMTRTSRAGTWLVVAASRCTGVP